MTHRRDYHVFTLHGDTVLCLPAGEIFQLDELAADMLELGECSLGDAQRDLGGKYSAEALEKAWREMKLVFCEPPRDHSETDLPRRLRALCLNITHSCNLACAYCFAERITGQNAGTMSLEVAKAALDMLCRDSGDIRRLQVDFFGGEPLLAFDRVKETTSYARSLESKYDKFFLFTLTTNAMLLNDDVIDFIKQENMSLILSLDGPEEIHNRYRKTRGGLDSHRIVLENIRKVQERLDPKDYYIRGTFTSQTGDIGKILEFYHDEGFFNVSLEPVSAPDDAPYALREAHLPALAQEYRNAARWMLDKPMQFFHFNLEMDNPLCLTRRITGCGAGVEYMVVDPRGDIYPCHQFVEEERFIMGNVRDGVTNHAVREQFKKSTIYSKPGCQECWARFYCSGGCHYQHMIKTGDINKPAPFYCSLFKTRLEAAIWYNMKRRNLGISVKI